MFIIMNVCLFVLFPNQNIFIRDRFFCSVSCLTSSIISIFNKLKLILKSSTWNLQRTKNVVTSTIFRAPKQPFLTLLKEKRIECSSNDLRTSCCWTFKQCLPLQRIFFLLCFSFETSQKLQTSILLCCNVTVYDQTDLDIKCVFKTIFLMQDYFSLSLINTCKRDNIVGFLSLVNRSLCFTRYTRLNLNCLQIIQHLRADE